MEELTTKLPQLPAQSLAPRLLETGYWGFDIIEFGSKIYALGQGQGAFDVQKFERDEYERCFVSETEEEVKEQVDEIAVNDMTPRLRETGYWGYNLIACARKIYGLRQDEGDFELEKAERGEYNHCYIGESLDEVKKQIDEAALEGAAPVLKETGFCGFNIIEYGTRFYALAQAEGKFDFAKFISNEYRHCYAASSIDDLKNDLVDVLSRTSNPVLLERGYLAFNLIQCGAMFYALAQNEGTFEIGKFQRGEYRRCFTGKSVDEVKNRVTETEEAKNDFAARLRSAWRR